MKVKRRVLGLLIAAVLLVTGSVFTTMAYLTDKDQVVNTFTVGKVEIMLDEAKVNTDGTYKTNHESRTLANEYHLLPGHTYIKDPTVTVKKGSEKSYVRMLVTISKAAELKEVFGNDFLPENYVEGWDNAAWIPSGITLDEQNNTLTYEFRYKEAVAAPKENVVLDDLFESFTVPGTISNEGLAKLKDMNITAFAHAIQADGFENADAAWTAFDNK